MRDIQRTVDVLNSKGYKAVSASKSMHLRKTPSVWGLIHRAQRQASAKSAAVLSAFATL